MNIEADIYHTPVLLAESVDGLTVKENGVYVDLTFGGGGHSRAILARLGARGRLYGFDQDMAAAANVPPDNRFTFVYGNFRYLSNFLRYYGIREVDGILADLGVSSHHFDNEKRGFSYRFDSMLDMRMNQFSGRTAADVLNTYPENVLKEILDAYGELNYSRKIAARIVDLRKIRPFRTVPDLLELTEPFIPRGKEKKFLSQIFQALRIEVNDELQALREMLKQSLVALKPGGRFSVITYHSLEDRLVKYFFRTGNTEGLSEPDFFGNIRTPFIQINNRVIVPTHEEAICNPRARSAKLRIAEKKQENEREQTIE